MKSPLSTEYRTILITRTSGAAIMREDGNVLALPISTVPTFWDKYKERPNGK